MKFTATALLLAMTMANVNGWAAATTTAQPVVPTPLRAPTHHEHRCIQDTDTVQGMIEDSTVISDAFRQWSDELISPNSTFVDVAAEADEDLAKRVAASDKNHRHDAGAGGIDHHHFDAANASASASSRGVAVKRLHTLNRTALAAMAQRHGWAERAEMRRRQLEEQRRAAAAQADETGPIRFSISTVDLTTSGKYCATASGSVPDMQGSTTACSSSDDILTAAKRTFLTDVLLPRATQILAQHLQVAQRTTNLVVASTVVCGPFSIPSTDASTGVADADYRLYIAAVPAGTGVLAWAAGCQLASDNRRFIVGRANFAPAYLEPDGDVDAQVVTAVHELTHALGFTYGRFNALGMTTSISNIRGKTTNAIDSPIVMAQAEAFYNCDSIEGVELEDEGGSGSANSHWEKRTAPEEIMTATSGERYSPLTLAAMETIGYTANYSSAWPMIIGRNAGCDFLTEKCNTAGGGKDTAFCFTAGATACTADYIGYGTCVINAYTSALPTYFQYFSNPNYGGPTFYDGCPMFFAYSNRRCINAAEVATSSEQVIGLYFGADSRCVPTSGLIKTGYTGADATGTCLKSRCVNGVVQVSVGNGGWLTCAADGQVLSGISGFSGTITCPPAAAFCLSFGGSSTAALLPLPETRAPIARGSNAEATEDKYTCKGTFIISGGGWGNVIRTAPSLLNAAVQMDIADVLGVELQQVLLLSTDVGSLVVVYVANGPTSAEANNAFTTMIGNGGRDGIGRTLYVYANYSGNAQDSPTAVSHNAVNKNDNICANTWSALDTDAKCYGVIAAVAVAAFLIVACIAVCITRRCCNNSSKENERQISGIGYPAAGVPVAPAANGGGRSNAHAVFPYQGTVRAAAAQQATYNYGGAPPNGQMQQYYGTQGVPVSAYPLSYGSVDYGGGSVRSGTPAPPKKGSNSPTGYLEGGELPPQPGRARRGTY